MRIEIKKLKSKEKDSDIVFTKQDNEKLLHKINDLKGLTVISK